MTNSTSLTSKIADILQDITIRREQIKEDWVKAWLTVNLPKDVPLDWLINNVEMVEQWSKDRLTVTWSLRLKEPK